jgi:hypothetical protein
MSDKTVFDHVTEAWAEALGRADFAADDNFFAIGGSSLAAIRVMRTLGARLGTKLPTRLLFHHQTPRDLAAALAEQLRSAGATP